MKKNNANKPKKVYNFSLNQDVYDNFSKTCKEEALSMSGLVEKFIKTWLSEK